MLKYFSQHLMRFILPRDSFTKTTVTRQKIRRQK